MRSYGITNAAPYASAPPVGAAGDTYYNTATKVFYLSDGTAWNAVSGGGGGSVVGQPVPSCRVTKLTNSQSLAPVGRTVILYESRTSDAGNMHNLATGIFVIPATGMWQVSAAMQVSCQNNPQESTLEVWQVGGAAALSVLDSMLVRNLSAGDLWTLSGTDQLYLTAGMSVNIRGYNGGGNAAPLPGNYQQCNASFEFVSPQAVALNSGVVGAAGIVAMVEATASGSQTLGTVVDMPGLTATITPVVGRRYEIEVQSVPVITAANAALVMMIRDGANTVIDQAISSPGDAAVNSGNTTQLLTTVAPASSAPITYKVSYYAVNANGYLFANTTTYKSRLIIRDAGISGQVQVPSAIVTPDVWNVAWGTVATAEVTSSQASIGTAVTDVTGLTVTFTAVAGRRYRLFAQVPCIKTATAGMIESHIADAANADVQVRADTVVANGWIAVNLERTISNLSGSVTYKVRLANTAGTTSTDCNATRTGVLRAEDIGPVNPIAPANWYVAQYPKVSEGNAIGIVGVGTTLTVTAGASWTLITSTINFTPILGRRYRITYTCRATGGAGSVTYNLRNGASIDGTCSPSDYYSSQERNYDSANLVWFLANGDNIPRSWAVYAQSGSANMALYDGNFFVEDVGPSSSPALPIPSADTSLWVPFVPSFQNDATTSSATTECRYVRYGRTIHASYALKFIACSPGQYLIGLPVQARVVDTGVFNQYWGMVWGTAGYVSINGPSWKGFCCCQDGFRFYIASTQNPTGTGWNFTFPQQALVGDQIFANITYEANN